MIIYLLHCLPLILASFFVRQGFASHLLQSQVLLWLLPVVLVVVLVTWMFRSPKSEASALGFGKRKRKAKRDLQKRTTFAEVAGYDEAKAELQEVIHFLRHAEKYIALGARVPHGILLIGPPGTGKTLLARAVAGESNVPFYSISGSEFVEMYVGLGAARVRDLFEQAKEQAPCIIFIDELDALGRSRSSKNMLHPHEEREQTLNQLLVEMDGFDTSQTVIVIAATNRPEILDPALLRAGRFDRQIVIDYPVFQDREEILRTHSNALKCQDQISFSALAAVTAGFSGADLANLVNEASLLATRRQASWITDEDFQTALERIVMGAEQKSKKLSLEEKRQAAYYQCGRALMTLLLSRKQTMAVMPLQKISILPRTHWSKDGAFPASLGISSEQKHITQDELKHRLCVLLSGRAAEEEWLHLISNQGQEDLQRATDLVRCAMIEYGMSRSLGLQAFRLTAQPFLDSSARQDVPVSDKTLQELDQEAKEWLSESYLQTRTLLRPYQQAVEQAVEELIEKETISWSRFMELIQSSHPVRSGS